MSQSAALSNQFKPAILQCFGDIASAIGGHFETYLSVVAQVLQQAAAVTASPDGSYEMYDYVISLREGIMDAWGGIIGAMKISGKSKSLSIIDDVFFLLTNQSPSSSTLRAVHLPAAQYHCPGYEQERVTDAVRHGSYRVSSINTNHDA